MGSSIPHDSAGYKDQAEDSGGLTDVVGRRERLPDGRQTVADQPG